MEIKMTRFVVDLGSVKLDERQKQAISSTIQAAVLSALAKEKLPSNKSVGFIPPDWLGLILRDRFADLEPALTEVSKFAGR